MQLIYCILAPTKSVITLVSYNAGPAAWHEIEQFKGAEELQNVYIIGHNIVPADSCKWNVVQ